MKICPDCQRTYADDIEFCLGDGARLNSVATRTEAQLAAELASRFHIVRRLGAGGMGTVFLAEQVGVGNRLVALKVLNHMLLDDSQFLLRFQEEAWSTGRIKHPNVVTIYESGQGDEGTPYIAMEFLEGESLRETLQKRGALPVAECAEILQQTARGLNAAHKLGIIHRDLKPDNIFLIRGDEDELIIKVVDFGIAKLRESATHTLTGMVLGTPAYISSEQAAGMPSDKLDARSDVYSLGIAVYEMLTGRVPFQSDTPLGTVRKHLVEDPPPFRVVAFGLDFPPQVESVVRKALIKDREQRYASTLDFAREFTRVASVPAPPRPPAPKPPAWMMEPDGVPRTGQGYKDHPRDPSGVVPSLAREPSALPPGSSQRGDAVLSPARPNTAVATPPGLMGAPSGVIGGLEGERGALPQLGEDLRHTPKPPPAPKPVPFPTAPERPGKMKFVIMAGVALIVVVAAAWYLSQPEKPQVEKRPIVKATPPVTPAGMVRIPGGTFMMGRDNAPDTEEIPAHSVTVAPFYIDKEPVTQAQYGVLTRSAPLPYPASQAAWPVTNVAWQEAQAYCGWVIPGGRLPSEAEWEFAARGPDGRTYPWGSGFSLALANSIESGLGHPEPVGSHTDAASPFGVLDMAGNVWQWCFDDYKHYPGNTSALEIPADAKVLRGGSFKNNQDQVTTTTRNYDHVSRRSPLIGFRCAKSM